MSYKMKYHPSLDIRRILTVGTEFELRSHAYDSGMSSYAFKALCEDMVSRGQFYIQFRKLTPETGNSDSDLIEECLEFDPSSGCPGH